MSEQRSQKAVSSFIFKFVESIGMQGISFVVNVILARLLDTSDYGVLSMLTVFISLSQVFVISGLNSALIQKKEVDEKDISSVFWLSLGIACVLYAILFLCAPAIAAAYRAPELKDTLRVLALVLLPGALVSVQHAMVARQMAFRRQMYVGLSATVVSGAVGIGMAMGGFSYWALVGQQLTNQVVTAVLLLFLINWKPVFTFSWNRLRGLIGYGWKLLASSLLDTGYSNLNTAVIGLRFSQSTLGEFTRGKQFPELLMNAVNGSITSVMMPVLSEQQDDLPHMKQTMRRSVMLSSFLVMPLMAGLAGIAEPMVRLLLTEKWIACVPYLQLYCIIYALYPIHTANLQAIKAMGRSDVFLKLEIIKKAYGLAILLVTVLCFDSVFAIALGSVFSSFISSFVNASPNKKLMNYSYPEQIRDLLPSMLLSVLMFGVVWAIGLLPLPTALLLVVQIAVGAALYAGLASLFKLESARYLAETLKNLRKR